MRNKNYSLQLKTKPFGIYVFMFGVCFRWLVDGVINSRILGVTILMLGLILICGRKVKIEKRNLLFFSFFAAIGFSLLANGVTLSQFHQALLVLLTLLFAICLRGGLQELESGAKFLVFSGFFCAATILLQLFANSVFNNLYFSLLTTAAKENAVSYANKGYYFGVNYRPHIAACSLCYALGALFFQHFANEKRLRAKKDWLGLLVLLICLMLTQKKGVLILSVLAILLVMLMVYATKRQWITVLRTIIVVGILAVAGYLYIVRHPNSVLLYRLSQFVMSMLEGNASDSGRGALYADALALFQENPIFGIGWRKFASLTTSVLGYSSSHQVNNDYLQLLCEMGLVGFVLFLIPMLIMLYRTCLVCRRSLQHRLGYEYRWLVFFAAFVQFFTVAYAAIEDPFYDIMTFTVYIFSCMIINGAYRELGGSRLRRSA